MTTSGAARGVSIEAIQRVPLFADLSKHEIQEIARLFKEHRFAKGETIVQEGSTGDTLFLIESGEAGVFIGGRGRTTMESPDYFGEVALIDEGTRMATICASSEVVCYGLTCRDFRALVEKNGVVGWKLLQRMVKMLRATRKEAHELEDVPRYAAALRRHISGLGQFTGGRSVKVECSRGAIRGNKSLDQGSPLLP
jgi:CRP-like cAMP-binding protein